jgi:hypothetical protein
MNEFITDSPKVFLVPKMLSIGTGVPPSPAAPLELPELLPVEPLLDPLLLEPPMPELPPVELPLLEPLLPELPLLPEPLLAPLLPEPLLAPLLPEPLLDSPLPELPELTPPELPVPESLVPGGTYLVSEVPQFRPTPPTMQAIGNTIEVARNKGRCMKSSDSVIFKGPDRQSRLRG